MSYVQWLFKAIVWLLLEWWEVVLSAFLASAGVDLTLGLNVLFGPNWQQNAPEILSLYGPLFLYLTATLLMFRWVRSRFFTHNVLKQELRQAVDDLNSDNIHLRMHALEDIVEITRKSRRLHQRGLDAMALYLRQKHPAQQEIGRKITLKKLRFGPPHANCSQQLHGDLHSFAQQQLQIEKQQIEADAQAVLEALSRRRLLFDDPRRWIDLSFTNLPSANLEKVSMKRFSFVGANLRHALFQEAKLNGCSFDGAILNHAFMTGADIRRASFCGIMAHRLHLDDADLRKANFLGADLYDISIQKADARGARFMGAQMWRAVGGLTDFSGADFINAQLQGADFHKSKNLTKTQIEGSMGAHVDKNTRLPWSSEEELRASGLV